MDNQLIPDAKLGKIVGMSELSAYRLGAQTLMPKREVKYHHPLNTLSQDIKPNLTLNQKVKPLKKVQIVMQLRSMTCLNSQMKQSQSRLSH